jgi:high-affinity nickel permease
MDYYQTLVIILSVTLAIFLLLAIIATVIFINILSKFKKVAENAEQVSNNIAEASRTMKKFAGPAAVANVISKFIKR